MKISSQPAHRAVFSVLLITIMLTGCSVSNVHNSKSMEGIDSLSQAQTIIKTGMSMGEVRSILGEPSFTNTFNNTTVWSYQSSKIKVNSGAKFLTFINSGSLPAD